MLNERYYARISLIFFCFCVFFAILIITLFCIQIKQHSTFVQLGQKQYQTTTISVPERALIFDRNGVPLALNKTAISAFIVPSKLAQPNQISLFLQQHFPHAYERLHESQNSPFLYIKRKVTDEQHELLKTCGYSDIKCISEPARFYPNSATACIVGITDIDGNGISGIELLCNEQLSGTPSIYSLEKDARSHTFYFKKEAEHIGQVGTSITITIDGTLQFLVHELLEQYRQNIQAKEASIIIMDPTNGAVLVMATTPSFDPNEPLLQSNIENMKNRIVTETYELGSVIKIFGALAALQEELVTPEELVDCKNTKMAYLQGRKITTWKEHGIIPFAQVIAYSNNIGIAQIAQRLDTKLYDHYIRLGFGQKTGIEFPGEQAGFVNPPEQWSKQSIYSLSYGYELRITLLQLARALSVIANGGYLIKPHLLMNDIQENQCVHLHSLYSTHALEQIRAILIQTTQAGTARRAQINGYTIMAKTGSANLIHNGLYDPTRSIFTCAGIVEKDAYKRVVIVCIKEVPKTQIFASTIAVPLFEQVVQKMLIHEKIINYTFTQPAYSE